MRPLGFLLVLLSPAASLFAQGHSNYGTITGRVFDSATRDSIPLATVLINGSTLGASTDDAGYFEIKRIPPGTYQVQASAVGYALAIQREIIVRSSQETKVTFSLTEQSIQVGEVLVTGEQIIVPDLPVSTEYLSYKEIHNSAGAFDDVIRNISTLPGVSQSRSDRNDLIVRGGSASENLFLVDNIEVSNIDHFGTEGSTGGSLSFINLEFVDNTAFSAGGFGVRYGDKLSSVMSIGIRDGRTDENHVKATVSATEVGLNLEGPVADGGSYLFSTRRSYLDPVFKYYGFAFAPDFWDFL
ncbi:MAG: TonB-dependent receptor, partial [Bacteroidota bacterium]